MHVASDPVENEANIEEGELKEAMGNTTPILDAPVTFIPGFLTPEVADTTLAALLAELPWERHISRMYAKDVPVPRMEVWVADYAYTYSRRTYQPISWTPRLLTLKAAVEAVAGGKYNSVLVNRYENEKDSVGWHADNEPEMSHEHPVASLSFGATRSFEMRKGSGPVQTIELEHGSLLVMGPGMQREWRHQVPKTKNPCGLRVNLTFRWMIFPATRPLIRGVRK